MYDFFHNTTHTGIPLPLYEILKVPGMYEYYAASAIQKILCSIKAFSHCFSLLDLITLVRMRQCCSVIDLFPL